MIRLCIIVAGGDSSRTGLGEYTTKAALPLAGKILLAHQIDHARRNFCADRVLVVCRPHHARLLRERLSSEDLEITSFVLSDRPTGWAGEVERTLPLVAEDDEVLLLSCDNFHADEKVEELGSAGVLFTYSRWSRMDAPPTDGSVLARSATVWGTGEDVWIPRSGMGFVGDFFSGYAVVRGDVLKNGLRNTPRTEVGKKEIVSLLAVLARYPGCRTIRYPGVYEDVADLRALARLDAKLRKDGTEGESADVGACVLFHDGGGRVFLTEREDGRGWVPPGGIVDAGESYASAAVREVLEEVGVAVDEARLRLLSVVPTRGKSGEPAVTVCFSARMGVPYPYFARSKEVREVRWFDRQDVQKIAIPFDLRHAIDDYFKGRELDTR